MLLLDALRQMVRKSTGGPLDAGTTMPSLSLDGEAPPLWQLSSFELMNGVDVTDFSNTISGEAFNQLFARGDR